MTERWSGSTAFCRGSMYLSDGMMRRLWALALSLCLTLALSLAGGPDAAAQDASVRDGAPEAYVVKKGDTLSEIARRQGTTVAALQKANNIRDPNKISVGMKLRVPRGGR